jgi:hypothetical protein
MALYDAGAKVSHEHGIELLLRGMLQSPRFLYRGEIGTTEQVAERRQSITTGDEGAWDAFHDNVDYGIRGCGDEGHSAAFRRSGRRMRAELRKPGG